MFIIASVSNVPLIDSSRSKNDTELDNTDDYEANCKISTSNFESWISSFLDRVFVVFENLSVKYAVDDHHNFEENLLSTILYTCESWFFSKFSCF
jgi:proteasome activator subunit 4